jgi:hypothetical protein
MTAEERIEEATMKVRLGMKLILGLLASSPISVFGQQSETERAVPIAVVVFDRANVKQESLAGAKQVVMRVMSEAGFEVTYVDTQDTLTPGAPVTDSSPQTKFSGGYLSIVITPAPFPGSDLNEAGFAAVTTGLYPRAYVFLDRVKAFADHVMSVRPERTMGTVLGHIICHELGHLLMPGKSHPPFGIMRGEWTSEQWDEAAEGLLLFSREQAEIMQSRIRDHCSAALARKRRPC